MSGTDNLNNLGTVKYYKGFLNHAYSLNTINAQKGKDLNFRIADTKSFKFNAYNSNNEANCLFHLNSVEAKFFQPLTVDNDVVITSDLDVSGSTTLSGQTNVSSTLNVTGETSINVSGDTNITGNLSVNSNVFISGNLSVANNAFFSNNVTITGTTLLEGSLSVDQSVTINDTLSVSGAVQIDNTLSVGGDVTFNCSLSVNNNVNISGILNVNQMNINSDLNVEGQINFGANSEGVLLVDSSNALFRHKDVSNANAALKQDSSGNTFINGTVVNIKNSNILIEDSLVTINCPLVMNDSLTINQTTTLNNTLSVNSLASFNDSVIINDTLSVSGEVTFSDDVTIAENKTLTVNGTSSVNNLTANSANIVSLNVNSGSFDKIDVNYAELNNLSVAGRVQVGRIIVTNCAQFNSNVLISNELSVGGDAVFESDVQVDGNLTVKEDSKVFLENGTSFTLKGESETSSDGYAGDDFSMRNNNGTFILEMSHVSGDTVNFASTVETSKKSSIEFNSTSLTLTGHESVIIQTEESDGLIEIKNKLSVSNDMYIDNTLTVNSYAIIDNSVAIFTQNNKATFSHVSKQNNSTGYALNQDSSGNVRLNAPSTKVVEICNEDTAVLTISENCVTSAQDLILSQELSVSGLAQFDDDVNVSGNLIFENDSTVSGSVSISGALSVGGESVFNSNVTFEGDVIVKSFVSVSGDVTVSNSATFNGTLSVAGPTTINNTLSVGGDTQINGTLSISNNLYIGDGEITYDSDEIKFKHSNATQTALRQNSAGITTIDSSNSVIFQIESSDILTLNNNSIILHKETTCNNDLNVNGSLTVSGDADIGDLQFQTSGDNVLIKHKDATTTALSQNGVNGNTTVGGDNSVIFNINGDNQMEITNDLVKLLSNSVEVTNNLSVSGSATIYGSLSVGGSSTFEQGLDIHGPLSVSNDVNISGNLSVGNQVTIQGATTINNNLTVNCNVYLNGDLIVKGSTTQVNIESTEVRFNDNAIILASNCNPDEAHIFHTESGIYVYDENIGFVYKHNDSASGSVNPGWQTKGSDLGISSDNKLFFRANNTYNTGWSMELDSGEADSSGNGVDEKDLVFKYYDGTGSSQVKLRIVAIDDEDDDDDAIWE